MRFLYSFLYTCAFFCAAPYFVIAGLIKGKYLSTAWERLGNITPASDRPSIWIHAVSVGELLASKTLIRKLEKAFPGTPLFVSTTTITGQKLAQEILPGAAFYFPFDWRWTVEKVLRRIKPAAVIVLETEIWPNFLWTCQELRIPTILVNGRISDRSMSRYRLVKRWLPKFSECWMQTQTDADRMKELGAEVVSVMGNLKFDFQPNPSGPDLAGIIRAWKGNDLLWIAGSTMRREERVILHAFRILKNEHSLKLLIAPRHPDRFPEVASLMEEFGLKFARRSEGNVRNADVLLLDTIGELAGVYEFADFVLIGGTLLEGGGGHNPIEPAYFGKPIVSGPNYAHFRSMFADFQRNEAIFITSDLLHGVRDLILHPEKGTAFGNAARALIQANSGATEIVVDVVRRVLQRNTLRRTPAVLFTDTQEPAYKET
jgi:3-deoxy-D-manno-octulosonic-acid transferase